VYDKEHKRQVDSMVAFLRTTVGVRSRAHAVAICERLNELQARTDGGVLSSSSSCTTSGASDGGGEAGGGKRLTICVEGNISAGKTTFLQSIIHNSPSLGAKVQVVPEPVDRWTSIPSMADVADPGGGGASEAQQEYNILGEFYKNPKRWGYTFQNWVFFTRFMQERQSSEEALRRAMAAAKAAGGAHLAEEVEPYRLMERSVFSDRLVFVEALKDNAQLDGLEMALYRNWFEFMLEDKPQLVPDAFIYLRAKAQTCFDRMNRRARAEEGGVPKEYLDVLHAKHEGWFLRHGVAKHKEKGFVVDQSSELRRLLAEYPRVPDLSGASAWEAGEGAGIVAAMHELMPESIRDQVVFLRAPEGGARAGGLSGALRPLHERALARIPALILDCDASVDVTNDAAVRERYAGQVSDFYGFVAALKATVFTFLGKPGRVEPMAADARAFDLLHESLRARLRAAGAGAGAGGRGGRGGGGGGMPLRGAEAERAFASMGR
jgi:deoxyadenosine/deoxycytidine kinase